MTKKLPHTLPYSLPHSINGLKTVHIIGVCGTLMGAFAAMLKRRGITVTGSDQNVYPPMSDVLAQAGVQLISGYRPENLRVTGGNPDLVVIGNVIRADNPEAVATIQSGIPYTSLPEAMEVLFLKETRNLVVAGTHGKTTTSSLLTHVLNVCGAYPSYFIGGVSQDIPFSFHVSDKSSLKQVKEPLFVLEGDEYDTAFWDKVPKFNHYLPNDVILTSVEYDHADIYPDFESVVKAFRGLVSRIRSGGKLIACFDDPVIRDLSKGASVPVISYGSQAQSGARFTLGKLTTQKEQFQIQILEKGEPIDQIQIQLPGVHNALNALSVWVECRELKLDPEKVREGFRTFRGVKRRQEERGEVKGVLVIDDFAHHPTAVRETLKALKTKYPNRRILTVFEPRSATSRRKVFQKQYAQAFESADAVWIAAPYDQARIAADDQFSSETLVQDIKASGKVAYPFKEVDEGVAAVAKYAQAGDLVAVLSNGGFGGFISKLFEGLKNAH